MEVALLASFTALAGVGLGAMLNWWVVRSNAMLQIQGQLAVARFNALREQRLREVGLFMRYAERQYLKLVDAEDWTLAPAEGRAHHTIVPTDEDDPRWHVVLVAVPDERLANAMKDFLSVHRTSEYAILYYLNMHPNGPPPQLTNSEAWENEDRAMRELSTAGRDYVFGSEPATALPFFPWQGLRSHSP